MKNKNDFSKIEIIQRIDALKSEIDKLRPIKSHDENRIMQKFRLDWNYNSNAIEGNSLTYGETRAFLMHGITAKGKPFKDYLDIRGHNEAIDYLVDFINNKEELTEAVIRELHKIILVEPYEVDALTPDGKPTRRRIEIGVYKKQPNHVKTQTGEIHYFASPEETSAKMEELMNWYRKEKDNKDMHPLILASFFHHRFAAIHPFDDGNGRMARLLMNLILMQNHFTPAVIRQNDRENYYSVLSQADAGEYLPFIEYIGEYLIHSMEIFIKGAKGENIDETDDLDKEIGLLKREIENFSDRANLEITENSRKHVFQKSIKPFLISLEKNLNKFNEFFYTIEIESGLPPFLLTSKNIKEIVPYMENFKPSLYSLFEKKNKQNFRIVLRDFVKKEFDIQFSLSLDIIYNKFEYEINISLFQKNHASIYNKGIIKSYNELISKQEIEEVITPLGKKITKNIAIGIKNTKTS